MKSAAKTRAGSRPVERSGSKASVPSKDNGNGKNPASVVVKPKIIENVFGRPPTPPTLTVSKGGEGKATKTYMDSARRGINEPSPVTALTRETWMHIYAEVSAFRYPPFLHRLNSVAQEQDATNLLWQLCQVMLSKEDRKSAAKSRLQRRAERGEIKIY